MQAPSLALFWCKQSVALRCVQIEDRAEYGAKMSAGVSFLAATLGFCKVGPHIAKVLIITVLNEIVFKLMN